MLVGAACVQRPVRDVAAWSPAPESDVTAVKGSFTGEVFMFWLPFAELAVGVEPPTPRLSR